MASLPEDIIMDVLLKSSVKSISRFKCVGKHWYELLNNPKFIKMHHQHAIQNNKFIVLLRVYHESQLFSYTIDFDVASSSYHMPIKAELPPDTFDFGNIASCDCLTGVSHVYGNNICLWNPLTCTYQQLVHTNVKSHGSL